MTENPRKIRLDGQRFGRWNVLHQEGNAARGGAAWLCRCDCGNLRIVLGADLRNRKSRSCGCLRAEVTRNRSRTHGKTRTRLYELWKNMHGRCRSTTNPDYGAKGIRVCARWNSYEAFQNWALGNGYRDDLTIERRDNSLGYSPGNCMWADKAAQALNRSNVRRLPDGRPVVTVARENGIPQRVAARRIRDGWPMSLAATHPYNERRAAQTRDESGRFID